MKVIYSESFLSDIKVESNIRLEGYSMLKYRSRVNNVKSLFDQIDIQNIHKESYDSIWESDTKTLSICLSDLSSFINEGTVTSSGLDFHLIYFFYKTFEIGAVEKIAFILVESIDRDDTGSYSIENLQLTLGNNLIDIKIPSYIISNLELDCSKDIKFLEGIGVCVGKNLYLASDYDYKNDAASLGSYLNYIGTRKSADGFSYDSYLNVNGERVSGEYYYTAYSNLEINIPGSKPSEVDKVMTCELSSSGGMIQIHGTADYRKFSSDGAEVDSGTIDLLNIVENIFTINPIINGDATSSTIGYKFNKDSLIIEYSECSSILINAKMEFSLLITYYDYKLDKFISVESNKIRLIQQGKTGSWTATHTTKYTENKIPIYLLGNEAGASQSFTITTDILQKGNVSPSVVCEDEYRELFNDLFDITLSVEDYENSISIITVKMTTKTRNNDHYNWLPIINGESSFFPISVETKYSREVFYCIQCPSVNSLTLYRYNSLDVQPPQTNEPDFNGGGLNNITTKTSAEEDNEDASNDDGSGENDTDNPPIKLNAAFLKEDEVVILDGQSYATRYLGKDNSITGTDDGKNYWRIVSYNPDQVGISPSAGSLAEESIKDLTYNVSIGGEPTGDEEEIEKILAFNALRITYLGDEAKDVRDIALDSIVFGRTDVASSILELKWRDIARMGTVTVKVTKSGQVPSVDIKIPEYTLAKYRASMTDDFKDIYLKSEDGGDLMMNKLNTYVFNVISNGPFNIEIETKVPDFDGKLVNFGPGISHFSIQELFDSGYYSKNALTFMDGSLKYTSKDYNSTTGIPVYVTYKIPIPFRVSSDGSSYGQAMEDPKIREYFLKNMISTIKVSSGGSTNYINDYKKFNAYLVSTTNELALNFLMYRLAHLDPWWHSEEKSPINLGTGGPTMFAKLGDTISVSFFSDVFPRGTLYTGKVIGDNIALNPSDFDSEDKLNNDNIVSNFSECIDGYQHHRLSFQLEEKEVDKTLRFYPIEKGYPAQRVLIIEGTMPIVTMVSDTSQPDDTVEDDVVIPEGGGWIPKGDGDISLVDPVIPTTPPSIDDSSDDLITDLPDLNGEGSLNNPSIFSLNRSVVSDENNSGEEVDVDGATDSSSSINDRFKNNDIFSKSILYFYIHPLRVSPRIESKNEKDISYSNSRIVNIFLNQPLNSSERLIIQSAYPLRKYDSGNIAKIEYEDNVELFSSSLGERSDLQNLLDGMRYIYSLSVKTLAENPYDQSRYLGSIKIQSYLTSQEFMEDCTYEQGFINELAEPVELIFEIYQGGKGEQDIVNSRAPISVEGESRNYLLKTGSTYDTAELVEGYSDIMIDSVRFVPTPAVNVVFRSRVFTSLSNGSPVKYKPITVLDKDFNPTNANLSSLTANRSSIIPIKLSNSSGGVSAKTVEITASQSGLRYGLVYRGSDGITKLFALDTQTSPGQFDIVEEMSDSTTGIAFFAGIVSLEGGISRNTKIIDNNGLGPVEFKYPDNDEYDDDMAAISYYYDGSITGDNNSFISFIDSTKINTSSSDKNRLVKVFKRDPDGIEHVVNVKIIQKGVAPSSDNMKFLNVYENEDGSCTARIHSSGEYWPCTISGGDNSRLNKYMEIDTNIHSDNWRIDRIGDSSNSNIKLNALKDTGTTTNAGLRRYILELSMTPNRTNNIREEELGLFIKGENGKWNTAPYKRIKVIQGYYSLKLDKITSGGVSGSFNKPDSPKSNGMYYYPTVLEQREIDDTGHPWENSIERTFNTDCLRSVTPGDYSWYLALGEKELLNIGERLTSYSTKLLTAGEGIPDTDLPCIKHEYDVSNEYTGDPFIARIDLKMTAAYPQSESLSTTDPYSSAPIYGTDVLMPYEFTHWVKLSKD